MTLFDCAEIAATQSREIAIAQAVLREAAEHFELTDSIQVLPHYADHIRHLLYAVESYLFKIQTELDKASKKMHEAFIFGSERIPQQGGKVR